MRPVDMVNNQPARSYRRITVRPLPESGLIKLEQALREQSWQEVLEAESADEKADAFQKVAMEMVNQAVPEKVRRIASDDQDWYTDALKRLDRRRRREFRINRRSNHYLKLCQEYQDKCKAEKKKFFKNIVRQAKEAEPGSWYRILKRISKGNRTIADLRYG
jgi:2-oxoglutarate dehydrogenase complex dehydrogenase (E1) component-like enzyme